MKDHILTEAVAKQNGIFDHCMYCNTVFDSEGWTVECSWFSNYIIRTCPTCKREHRFKDDSIHTIEDLLEKMKN